MSEQKKPDQWWELISYFKPEEGKEYRQRGHRVFICGNIGDVTVAQINEVYGNDQATVARIQAAKQVLDTLGIEQSLVVTDSVRFVRMRPVQDAATLAQLQEKKEGMMH